MKTFILLFQCPDKKGIVARLSEFIFKLDANIITADQYSTDPFNGRFFIRIEFVIDDKYAKEALDRELVPIAEEFQAQWALHDSGNRLRMGILVSKPDHCLFDLLYLWKAGELKVDIPFVISNYPGHKRLVEQFGLKFHYINADKDKRMEEELLALVKDSDFLALARYMLVLSPGFLKAYGKDIINIHHGFLPSFKGANPYRQAFERGVKVIGATSHFVSEHLDEGPIIAQAVKPVTHRDDPKSLTRKGKNLEKIALSTAIVDYIDYRVIKYGNRTIIF